MTPSPLWSETTGPPNGPLIVLVHGSMDRSAGLLKLARRLDDDHRVLRYDRRGYGRSTPHAGPFDMGSQVDDLASMVDGRAAVVFGHSYGGNVALALANRHPELVRAVAVYESPLSWLEWWPTQTAGGNALAVRDGHVADPADAAERFMRRLVGDERWNRLPERTRRARREEGPAMVGELRDLHDHPPWDPAAVTMPVVAMRGEHGAKHHRRSTAYLAATLPDCRIVDIHEARHFGPNTHPDAVAAVITDLVTRLPSDP